MFSAINYREVIARIIYVGAMVTATIWLIGQTEISYYLEIGQIYLSGYLSGEHDGNAYAGMILSRMFICVGVILAGAISAQMLENSRDKKIAIFALGIISGAILMAFANRIYDSGSASIAETPWIFLSTLGSITIVVSEIYFLLIRPFTSKRFAK